MDIGKRIRILEVEPEPQKAPGPVPHEPAAGLFDGEGCTAFRFVSPNGQPLPYVSLQIGQVHPAVLLRFLKAVRGVGTFHGSYGRGGNRSPRYDYNANGFRQSQAVIAFLWKWLSGPKKLQASSAFRRFHEESKKERR